MNHVTNVKDDVVFVEDTAAPLSKNNVEEELASHLDCLDKAGGEDFEDSWVVKRLVRKVDYRLMPILSLTYSFSLIDRVNLPNVILCRFVRCRSPLTDHLGTHCRYGYRSRFVHRSPLLDSQHDSR